jgi:hypothetical protein
MKLEDMFKVIESTSVPANTIYFVPKVESTRYVFSDGTEVEVWEWNNKAGGVIHNAR